MLERGMLMGAHKLADSINEILRNSAVDDIKVPPGTDFADMAWQFSGYTAPTRIIEASKEQLLQIVSALLTEISKAQKAIEATREQPLTKIQEHILQAIL